VHDVDDGPGRVLGPWGAPDLTAFLRARLSDAGDTATVRFWDRTARAFVPVAQRDLFHQAAACGARLIAGGVAPGDPVLVVANRPEAILTAWFGAVLVGAHPAVVPVRRSFDDPEAAAARLRGTAAMLGPRTRAAIEVGAGGPAFPPATLPGSVLVDLDELRRDIRSLPLPPPELRPTHPDDVAYLQLTSGSTGAGRAVAVTHRGLIANIEATATRLAITPDDRFVSWLPLYHDMGLVGMALLGLLTASDTMLLTPFEFVADPTAWLGAFGDAGATITATPNFALERCCERIADPVAAGRPVRPGGLRTLDAEAVLRPGRGHPGGHPPGP
jgi:fatty-acyl-CoA synthase